MVKTRNTNSARKYSKEEVKAVRNLLDRRVGRGFAKNNPDLVTALLNAHGTRPEPAPVMVTNKKGDAGRGFPRSCP